MNFVTQDNYPPVSSSDTENQSNARSSAKSDTRPPFDSTSTTGGQTNNLPPNPEDGYWLPEVVVVGQYNSGSGSSGGWSNFMNSFQNNAPSDLNSYWAASGYGGNGGSSSTSMQAGPIPFLPNRADARNGAFRYPSFCNGVNDLWRWGFKDNDAVLTVEMSGYMLEDGTFLTLPWDRNDGVTSNFPIGRPFRSSYNGLDYVAYTGNGNLYIQVNNRQTGTSYDQKVVGYVHTHPWTDQNHLYSAPTPQTAQQPYGDYQLSHDYNIPGYIVHPGPGGDAGNLTVTKFSFDQASQQRQIDEVSSKDSKCPTQ